MGPDADLGQGPKAEGSDYLPALDVRAPRRHSDTDPERSAQVARTRLAPDTTQQDLTAQVTREQAPGVHIILTKRDPKPRGKVRPRGGISVPNPLAVHIPEALHRPCCRRFTRKNVACGGRVSVRVGYALRHREDGQDDFLNLAHFREAKQSLSLSMSPPSVLNSGLARHEAYG